MNLTPSDQNVKDLIYRNPISAFTIVICICDFPNALCIYVFSHYIDRNLISIFHSV